MITAPHEIDDIRVFEILDNPLRLRILRHLEEPRSVKEVAADLGVPVTRLYYHFRLLEEAGVIRATGTRKVGAMIETSYVRLAGYFTPSQRLVEGDHDPDHLARIAAAVTLDAAKVDAESGLRLHFEQRRAGSGERLPGGLSRSIVNLDAAGVRQVTEKMNEVLELLEQIDLHDEGTEYSFTYAFFPVAGSARREGK
jgi:DNA-binding transcriptional ArsR family regulator